MGITDPTIDRLEKWKNGHKARSVCLDHDDGYGASCWMIQLRHENGTTRCQEVAFVTSGDRDKDREAAKKQGVVTANDFDEDCNDWPGLAKTINCAIDAFEQGIWTKKTT